MFFAGELLAGGLGVISLELEIPCSHLHGGDGKDRVTRDQPRVSREGVLCHCLAASLAQ